MIQIDMEMPKSCLDCSFYFKTVCPITNKTVSKNILDNTRHKKCPLKEVPSGENIMIINKDKLHCDCQWDYEDDYYTAYSMYAIEAAQIKEQTGENT